MIFCKLSHKDKIRESTKRVFWLMFNVVLNILEIIITIDTILDTNSDIIRYVLSVVSCLMFLCMVYWSVVLTMQLVLISRDKTIYIYFHGKGYPELYFIPWMDDVYYNNYLEYLNKRSKHSV